MDTTKLPPNTQGLSSWWWWVLFAVLVGLVLAGMFRCWPQPTGENSLVYT
jgi:hypothetical protein